MKNFKKLFAILAATAMFAGSLNLTTVSAASFSNELQGAYDYAYGIGITTQPTIDTANMYGNLTRGQMAKMMVNFAKEVKRLTPDTSITVNFSDVADQSAEFQGYITEAAQMGLMGINSDGTVAAKFNPNNSVTRGEFGTVLDRVLNGTVNNGGTPFYAAHLLALKNAGIMTMISTPNATEVRGYVMLMMQRASEGTTTPATCNTAENILACSIGINCPAECQNTTPVVKAGSLNISLNSASAANGTQVPSTGTVRFAVVNFAAGSSDIGLNTVTIKKVGLASIPTTTRVWFELNGVRVSGKAAFTSDGTAIISFAPTYVVKAGSTATLDLYVDLATLAGQDFQFTSDVIGSTAQDTNGGFTTPVLRTATYAVNSVVLSGVDMLGSTYNASSDAVELGAFKLTNNKDTLTTETRDVTFKSITLRLQGTASLSSLSNITLVRNGIVVSSNPTINGRDLTFSVNNLIKDSQSATYYIKAVVNTVEFNNGDQYQFAIRYATDVNAIETASAFRTTVTTDPTLGTYTVQGGDMTFTRDSSVALANNYAAGSSNVILMQGTISAKNAVTLEDVNLTSSVNGSALAQLFSTIYLKIGSSVFSYSPAAGDLSAKFLGTATVNGTVAVQLYGTLRDTASATTVKFGELTLLSFTTKQYVANSNNVTSSIGSIPGVTVTVQNGTLNVTKNDALGNQTIAQGANGLLVYGLSLTSDQGNGATVSNAVFQINSNNLGNSTTTTGLYNNAYLTLFVNGTPVGSKTVQGSTVSFDSFNVNVVKGSPVLMQIKANLTDAFSTGTLQVSLTGLNAVDSLTSKTVSYAKPVGATFTIAAASGVIATSDNNPQAQLFLSPSSAAQLLAFKLTAKNDNVSLYDVNLSGSNIAGLSNFRLTDATGNVIATATTADTANVLFTQIANAPAVTKDASATYYVVADVNSNTTIGTVTLTLNSADIKATNGTVVPLTFSAISSRNHGTAENTLVVAKAANPSKLLTTSALRFTVTAAGKSSVSLDSVALTNLLAGYTGGSVTIYKNSVSSANIAAQGAIGAGTYTFTANNTVDAGNTVTYIVAIEGAVVNPNSYSQDWSVSLTNVVFGGLNANAYFNVGSFPITETK